MDAYGHPDTFARLRETISRLEAEGYAVHHGGVSTVIPDGVTLTVAQQKALARWDRKDALSAEVLQALGLDYVARSEGLPALPSWQNVDITFLELVELIGTDAILTGSDPERSLDMIRQMPPSMRSAILGQSLDAARRTGAKLSEGNYDDLPYDPAVIVHHRNIHAARAALREPGDLVLVRESQNVLGIGTFLLAAGFGLDGSEWMTVLPAHVPAEEPPCDPEADATEAGTAEAAAAELAELTEAATPADQERGASV